MRKRRWLLPGCLAFWLLVSALAGFVFVLWENSKGTGSMSVAVKMRPTLEAMPEPDGLFVNRDTGQFGIRFSNGDWVTGVAKDSHGYFCDFKGGGTVVLKDSRGRVRCFFGHVCGTGGVIFEGSPGVDTLDGYNATLEKQFTEQRWP